MMPILEYGATVWGYTCKKNINRIQRIINLCARIISNNYDFINCRGEDLVKELGWNTFEERRDFLLAVLMYKCHQGTAPAYLIDKLCLQSHINGRITRHLDDKMYYIPKTRTKAAESAFMNQGPTLWNNIPLPIRNAPSLDTFNQGYKKEILE